MAAPITLPAFELADGQVAVVKKGTVVIGQAMRINPQQQAPTSKHARLGSPTKKTLTQPVETTVSFEIYTEHTLQQLAHLLGSTTMPTTGWAGTEKLQLNPTITPYDLKIEVYSTTPSVSTTPEAELEYTYTLHNFKPNSLNINFQADGVSMVTVNGDADEGYITPAAGLGV